MVLSNFNVFFNGILQTKSWYVCNMLAALPFSERKREWIKKKLHDIQDKVHDSNFFHKMKASINVKSILIYVAWCFIVTVIVETLARYQANGTVTGACLVVYAPVSSSR